MSKLIDKEALITKLLTLPGVGSNSDALGTIKCFPTYEPQQPVVPKFVAKWFEEHKSNLDYHIWEYIRRWESQDKTGEFFQWLNDESEKPIETLVRMKDGYEVEKIPKWIVKRPDGTIVTQFSLWGADGGGWSFDSNYPKPLIFTNKEKADAVALLLDGEVAEG